MKKAYEVGKAIYERTPDQKIQNLGSKIPGEVLKIIESRIDEAIDESEHTVSIVIENQVACNTKKVQKLLELLGYKSIKVNPEGENLDIHFEIPKYSPPSCSRRD